MNNFLSIFKTEKSKQQICNYGTSVDQFIASIVLSAVGDALGYKNGSWEFSKNGEYIMKEAEELGGVMNLELKLPEWTLSDDTIMHIATAKALLSDWFSKKEFHVDLEKKLYPKICEEYVICWSDMTGRAPGIQCANAMPLLKSGKWNHLNFSGSGGGCGAAMRAMCIGLLLHKADPQKDPVSLELLIAIGIESGRMTHNHPTGFLGSVVAALFTAYAVQKVPLSLWGYKLIHEVLPLCYEYLKHSKRNWTEYSQGNNLKYFEEQWEKYLKLRKINSGKPEEPVFPEQFGFAERDAFYKSVSFSGWGGSSGHDSVLIAYDALLGCKGSWEEFCLRGALHGGDSDSTAAIGGAWFGVLYGFQGVPKNHYEKLEYREILEDLARRLYDTTVQFYAVKDGQQTPAQQAESNDNSNTTAEQK
mmetsp:Transcript_3186/g.4377  ORF Transcript_3186/g.4377 Transcript_3186/m.4377 type:complete len:418 (+) Transcript_3186:78-1331(+)